MTKRRIALLVSVALAAPAGFAALDEAADPAAPAEWSPQAADVSTEAPAQPDMVALQDAAPVVPVAQAEPMVAPQPMIARRSASTLDDPFSQADFIGFKALPAQASYLARLERERATQYAGVQSKNWATANAGPESGMNLLPGQVAYFERMEQSRMAAAQPAAPVADAQASTPASGEQTALLLQ